MSNTQLSNRVAGKNGPALTVRSAYRTFEPDTAPVRALRGVDLDISRGEFVALTGPSGCGKSTLLQLLAGLDRPDSGSVEVAGYHLDGLSDDELARFRRDHIGFVFQFFQLLESMSALENVALACLIGGAKRPAALARAGDLLDLLGLLDKAGTAPAALSGGQRQRLAIARALANSPTLLLADEPTGSLDSAGASEILELFQRLHANGQTILLVTHNAEVAQGAGRVVSMRDGRIEDRLAA
ncbi:MAG: ABC transporter ATP-binding protein [Nakamurella sp.]